MHTPHKQQQQQLSVQEAVELLHFCTSDLVVFALSPPEPIDASADSDRGQASSTAGSRDGADSAAHTQPQQPAGGVSDLMSELPAQVSRVCQDQVKLI